ncbi:hypothetical protein EVAR_9614_1 [Eumeta japonica]|uniref:Mos1 transposase HTH domain-containing protein n=1 Tax=Eumeta variegata TaxID=151549 RepID=A0A4C1TJI9_EUMVA|nr:hypothetical protein EVAR_9614_1 [Eumeta japonica]
MNLKREKIRAMLLYHLKQCHLKQQEIYNKLRLVLNDKASSFSTACNWFNEFENDGTNLTDDLRERRLSTAVTEDNVSAVRLTIETDKRVTTSRFVQPSAIQAFGIASAEPRHPSPVTDDLASSGPALFTREVSKRRQRSSCRGPLTFAVCFIYIDVRVNVVFEKLQFLADNNIPLQKIMLQS